ncbi:toprim domain-containing protein [Flavobacterium sp.]|uniref:toprim domain-containing protein n=1 Tax=Flavobacterium sp. TaxID=239 RepID=UPI002B5852C6|nr:toprim domain-containing protein [Flavobacterium sp.]HSD07671.1 toprim domain-containing protein [Flavobacterium sp.]
MNITQAKEISLNDLLKKIGFTPIRSNQIENWYLSPFRIEKTPSFKVNIKKNVFYDFGEGFGGNVIDFAMRYYNCSIKEALARLEQDAHVFSFHQQTNFIKSDQIKNNYEIRKVQNLQNKNLLEYAKSRNLGGEIIQKYCKEVHYSINDKKYYGIGFQNDAGGFEIRNKYVKMVLGKKEITTLNNHQNSMMFFESWSDFISFLTLYPAEEFKHDYIILNSVTMLEKSLIQIYKCINVELYKYIFLICCFDNDEAGDKATKKAKEKFPEIFKDGRIRYKNSKDLNDYLNSFHELY